MARRGMGLSPWSRSIAWVTARSGPSIMIDHELHGRVSAQRFDELMQHARASVATAGKP